MTQDDVLFPHLTVKETLRYAALLRLPKKLTKEEKEKRAMDVIYELGLERQVLHFFFSPTKFVANNFIIFLVLRAKDKNIGVSRNIVPLDLWKYKKYRCKKNKIVTKSFKITLIKHNYANSS